jgi:SSS family solute:Na+ symporter
MGSLASVFNSCSTLFTMDIYQKLHRSASERQLVWVGRIATGMMVIIGLLWIPIIKNMPGTLYGYLQSVQSYIAPPIAAVFFLGIFVKRVNAYGCMTGLTAGFLFGMGRLAAEIADNTGAFPHLFADGTFLKWFAATSYTFICIYLTVLCSVLIAGVSLLTPKPDEKGLAGLTYWTTSAEHRQQTRESWNALDIILTAGLLAIIISIYAYFTG